MTPPASDDSAAQRALAARTARGFAYAIAAGLVF